jgi:hypothetical protein
MKTPQVRVLVLACSLIAVAATVAGSARAGASAPVLVRDVEAARGMVAPPYEACVQGRPVTATCVQPDTVVEPSIAVNPADPLNAVAVFQEGRIDPAGDASNGWATTFDGGKTWTYGHLRGVTKAVGGPYDRASDAVVAFGPDNYVYANSLVVNDTQSTAGLTMNVSRDGGRTWGEPSTIIYDSTGSNDKNWIVVDNSDALGHHKGRVYVVWDRGLAPVIAAYSDDHGQTWNTGGIGVPGAARDGAGYLVYPGQGIGALPLVMPNGDLAVVFSTIANPGPVLSTTPKTEYEDYIRIDKIMVATARGAGLVPSGGPLVFSPAVTAAVPLSFTVRGQRAGEGIPAAAIDPHSGKMYIAWNDGRFRTDRVNDIVVTSSPDGATWSQPVRVNPGARDDFLDRWCPMIGVGDDGRVHVAYRERQEIEYFIPELFAQDIDTMYQESTDGGATFGPPLQVDSVTSDVGFGAVSRGGVFLGDYDQLAVAGDITYIARTEAVRTSADEAPVFSPWFHHQRLWVAVVGSR